MSKPTKRGRGRQPVEKPHHKTSNVELAAWLWADKGLRNVADLANAMGCTEDEAVALLAEAERRSFLEIKSYLSSERMMECEKHYHLPELRKKLTHISKGVFLEIAVVSSGDERDSVREHVRRFAVSAAPILSNWLLHAKQVGIAWGFTLSAVLGAMKELGQRAGRRRVDVIPICGEPLGFDAGDDSSSRLAAALADMLNSEGKHAKSLAGIPAIIPQDFSQTEIAAIKRLLKKAPGYVEIFEHSEKAGNKHKPLVEQIDTLITSVGSWRMASLELKKVGDLDPAQIDQLLGDIGGVLLPKNPDGEAAVAKIRELWTGLKMEHIESLALRAKQSAEKFSGVHISPGVIVLASGANKAQIIFEAVKRGIVNRIICNWQTSDELCRLAGIAQEGSGGTK